MNDTGISETDSLLRQAKGGNSKAQAKLLEHYRDSLRRMIAIRLDKRLAARVDASDIVQDTMHTAQQRLPEYFSNPHIEFFPWLRRIAWDRLTDLHRMHLGAARRSVLREHPWEIDLTNDSVANLARSVASSNAVPLGQAIQAEQQERVQAALMQLKPHDREILVLRYLEQLDVAEVASVLGISHTAVTTRHLRALKRLRDQLGDHFGS